MNFTIDKMRTLGYDLIVLMTVPLDEEGESYENPDPNQIKKLMKFYENFNFKQIDPGPFYMKYTTRKDRFMGLNLTNKPDTKW
jgi:hypothetical protein